MERHLPIVDIAGTLFYVDVIQEELRQQDSSTNRISFNELEETEDGYSLLYDTKTKNVPDDVDEVITTQILRVTLPALMELDPEGISQKFDIPLEFLLAKGPFSEKKIIAKTSPFHLFESKKEK